MNESSLSKNHTEEDVRALGERLYVSHYTPLYRYLFFRLRNKRDAEDLVQTVFVKAFCSLKDGVWDGAGDIHYLFTIARNTLIDYFRRGKHAPITSDELIESFADSVTTSAPVEERENRELIALGIGKLKPAEAEAVTLRYLSDMDYGEIAKLLGKREDAVRQLVHRGIKSLRIHLESTGLLD
jgi:RNA polymerase sigma-70 factor (ECF subfamily)